MLKKSIIFFLIFLVSCSSQNPETVEVIKTVVDDSKVNSLSNELDQLNDQLKEKESDYRNNISYLENELRIIKIKTGNIIFEFNLYSLLFADINRKSENINKLIIALI